jgi:hypothetical protein
MKLVITRTNSAVIHVNEVKVTDFIVAFNKDHSSVYVLKQGEDDENCWWDKLGVTYDSRDDLENQNPDNKRRVIELALSKGFDVCCFDSFQEFINYFYKREY